MDTEKSFFDYPRAAIERRKLMRQLRRTHLQSGAYLVSPQSASCDLFKDLAALEQELAQTAHDASDLQKCVLKAA
jgi:uncharacterized heparinase superfamily protein